MICKFLSTTLQYNSKSGTYLAVTVQSCIPGHNWSPQIRLSAKVTPTLAPLIPSRLESPDSAFSENIPDPVKSFAKAYFRQAACTALLLDCHSLPRASASRHVVRALAQIRWSPSLKFSGLPADGNHFYSEATILFPRLTNPSTADMVLVLVVDCQPDG